MAPNDTDIIQTMRRDAEEGFRLLMAKYEQPLYWHIRRLVVDYDDAKDTAQETFIRIYRSFGQYSGGSFSAWLYRIATNEALRTIDRRHNDHTPLEALADMSGSTYVDYEQTAAVLLQQAILQLPPKQQAAFNMRHYDDMDYQSIAAALDCSPASAKVNYHLAKEKITKYITTHNG